MDGILAHSPLALRLDLFELEVVRFISELVQGMTQSLFLMDQMSHDHKVQDAQGQQV